MLVLSLCSVVITGCYDYIADQKSHDMPLYHLDLHIYIYIATCPYSSMLHKRLPPVTETSHAKYMHLREIHWHIGDT